MPASYATIVPRAVLPLAVLATLGALAAQGDPTAGAETGYLARLAAVVLAAAAALAPRPARAVGAIAVLTVTAVWTIGPGTTRGAVTVAILILGLGLAAAQRLAAAGVLDAREHRDLPHALTVPLAIGLQALLRGDLLLPPLLDLRTLVLLIAAPVACALALGVLATRIGARRALLAGAATVALAPGWTVATTLALVAAAGGVTASDGRHARWLRLAAAAAVVAPLVWSLERGLPATLGGVALALATAPPRRWRRRLIRAGALVLIGATAIGMPNHLLLAALIAAGVLLPSLAWPEGRRLELALAGLALALAASVDAAVDRDALAAGVVALAAAVRTRGAIARMQGWWSAGLLAAVTALAAYPWDRAAPLDALLAFSPAAPGATVATLVALVSGLGALAALVPRRAAGRVATILAWALAMTVAGTVVAGRATAPRVLIDGGADGVAGPVALSDARAGWVRRLEPPATVSTVVLDSALIESLTLAPGESIAAVQLLDEAQRPLVTWRLHNGEDSAEWAASRADVAARPGFVAPPPWSVTVAPDGKHFAQRFRRYLDVPAVAPVEASWVLVRRRRDLPARTRLVLYRLELRP